MDEALHNKCSCETTTATPDRKACPSTCGGRMAPRGSGGRLRVSQNHAKPQVEALARDPVPKRKDQPTVPNSIFLGGEAADRPGPRRIPKDRRTPYLRPFDPLLLLRAGDIEQNPGPTTPTANPPPHHRHPSIPNTPYPANHCHPLHVPFHPSHCRPAPYSPRTSQPYPVECSPNAKGKMLCMQFDH